MKEGDTVELYGKIFTILLIEGDTVHLIDSDGEGIAVLKTEL